MKLGKEILLFNNRRDWRTWLANNFADASEAWIVIQKKRSTAPGIFLDEAVEEALCYGWIDSTLSSRDQQSYLLRFSPRKPNSVWSISNIRRVEMLTQAGRMEQAGLDAVRAGKESGEWKAAMKREDPEYMPQDLTLALKQDPAIMDAYRKLPVSRKKQYVYWVQSAKQEETRQNRILEILRIVREEG